jgi:hypothetical protein
MKALHPFLVLGALTTADLTAGVEEAPSADPTYTYRSLTAWDSHYASEGRDNLEGAPIGSILLELEKGDWLLGSWLAASGDADYEERNFFIERGFEWKGIEGYFGYKFLQFPGQDNEDDNEFGAGLSGPELPLGLVPAVNWYCSVDARGSYLEGGLSREVTLTDALSLEPSLMIGRNDGYISDGHNGLDHVRFALVAHYRVNDRVGLYTHIGRSFALDSTPAAFAGDALLKDIFHGGIGIAVTF